MSDNVVNLGVTTKLPLNPSVLLEKAKEANLRTLTILGFREDGSLYFAMASEQGEMTLALLAVAQKRLVEVIDSQS